LRIVELFLSDSDYTTGIRYDTIGEFNV